MEFFIYNYWIYSCKVFYKLIQKTIKNIDKGFINDIIYLRKQLQISV